MSGDIDFDGGRATARPEHVTHGRLLFEALVDTASGHPTTAEQLGFGAEEITPWRMGAVL